MKTKNPSPSRSQGAHTPRRKSRRTLSVGSPALSTASGRLTSIVQGFINQQMDSFVLSPLPKRRSVLTDNTEVVEEPRRKSWWKNLNENSRDVLEALQDNNEAEPYNIMEELDMEILSQEPRKEKNITVDIPESDGESIHSIVIPQKKLFPQKENRHQKFDQIIGNRESMTKSNKNTINDIVVNAGRKELFQNHPRSKPLFPAALLDITPDKTIMNKTKERAETKLETHNLFGNRQGTKRKNMFANFIASESEDEIPEIQPKKFQFPKKPEPKRRGSSASRGVRDSSPMSNVTTDTEMDEWRLLPSSTMVEHQLEVALESNTPKRPCLSKLSETKESSGSSVPSKTKSPEANTSMLTRSKLRALNDSTTSTGGERNKTLHKQSQKNQSKRNSLKKNVNESRKIVESQQDEEGYQEVDNENIIVEVAQEPNQSHKEHKKQNEFNISRQKAIDLNQEVAEGDKVNECQEIEINHEEVGETEQELDVNQEKESKIKDNESQEIAEEDVEDNHNQINESQEEEDENEDHMTESKEGLDESMEQEDEVDHSQQDIDENNEIQNEIQEKEDENIDHMSENKEELDESMEQEDEVDHSQQDIDENNEAIDQSQVNDDDDEENVAEIDQSVDEMNQINEVPDKENELAEKSQDLDKSNQEANESIEVNESQMNVDKDIDENNQKENESNQEANESNEVQNAIQADSENEDVDEDENEVSEAENDVSEKENNVSENDYDVSENDIDVSENENEDSECENEDSENENVEDENEAVEEDESENVELHYESANEEMEVDDELQNDQDDTTINQSNKTNTPEPAHNESNISHDTTGRNRHKHTLPEVILHDKTERSNSFTARRNTSIRENKTIGNLLRGKPSLMPARDSVGFSDGTTNSSAEGSGWDSHRTTRKTIRQTFGRDATPRKSLRALVMEKSAKRQTLPYNSTAVSDMPEISHGYLDIQPIPQESTHEVSLRTRQLTLEAVLDKVKEDNLKKRAEIEEAVKKSLATRPDAHIFKAPVRPMFPRRRGNQQTKTSKVNPMWRGLPNEVIEDLQYKPPKRFKPTNAPWITKRLYKFLENKLEPKYDYRARVRAEKLVETVYNFTKELRRQPAASEESTNELKHEMARLQIVKTHHEFYEFFRQFMPKEIMIKVIPDVVNNLPMPRGDVFSDIIATESMRD